MNDVQQQAMLAASRLIQLGYACETALSTAAEVAESREAYEQYLARAASWTQFCVALTSAVQELGGIPPRRPVVAVALQRAWIKIKSGVGDAEAIATQCSKHETEALRYCALVAQSGLPPEMRAIVRSQLRHPG